ncbi:hypothetical protein ROJ8625_00927 [Roseivivax jejudonensis]|uniref:Uncharacterized protein n=1 Tax=Roseivivax jejudonensis TaxID=1529041 RepID=A0A1X6YJF1_9RHOB|nr:hypothetical protein [Roseivivax jejudonensis]SLN23224.1 hypothetical protein ROJ8625_00927 [Roseivivax jejudonensis]
MADPSLYKLDEAGMAIAARHFARLPQIRSDAEFADVTRQVVRISDQQSRHTPVEARALVVAMMQRLIEYGEVTAAPAQRLAV